MISNTAEKIGHQEDTETVIETAERWQSAPAFRLEQISHFREAELMGQDEWIDEISGRQQEMIKSPLFCQGICAMQVLELWLSSTAQNQKALHNTPACLVSPFRANQALFHPIIRFYVFYEQHNSLEYQG